MDNTEVSVSSTATRTWHDFLERMRQPSASEFVKAIKSFIVTFSNNATTDPERESASVQEFFGNMEAAFRAHPLWAGRTEEELDNASEGLEKYIMTKLFTRVFASHPDDVKVDHELNEKSALIQQFIQPEHLEIQPMYRNETWVVAQKELQKINSFKAPRDKLACILSCCKVISNLLFNASVSGDEKPPGADDFLPVLIYVTIKANPPQLHSNLLYIQRYRNKSRLVGEAAYVFTNMLSAESFILNIDAKALSMDETEFAKNMEFARTLISSLSTDYNGENKQTQSDQSETVSDSKLKEIPSVSDLENKGAMNLVREEKVSETFQNFPFLYSKAGDLTVGDVDELLNGYKQLVFKYVCLAKGLGVPVLPHQAPETRIGAETDVAIEGKEGVSDRDTQSDVGGVTAEGLKNRENMGSDGDVFGNTKDVGKVSGVSTPPSQSSEARTGGETVDAPPGKRDVELDDQLDNTRVEGVRIVASATPEYVVAGDVSQVEENVEI